MLFFTLFLSKCGRCTLQKGANKIAQHSPLLGVKMWKCQKGAKNKLASTSPLLGVERNCTSGRNGTPKNAKQKIGEGIKADVYAGMVYERMGGVFEMYDVLSEDQK